MERRFLLYRSNILRNSEMPNTPRRSTHASASHGEDGALSFRSIHASPELLRQLRQRFSGAPVPILLVGEEGAGKHYIARRLAAAWLCERPDPEKGACGTCTSCHLMNDGAHFDHVVVEPPEGKGRIPVALVRERVSETLDIFPQISRRRVYTVNAEKADNLSEQGQNALLKPLEEHPEFVRFILLVEDAERLLPTIVSRCAIIRIGRRSEQDIASILRAHGVRDEAAIKAGVRFGEGLPGQALHIAEDESFQALRERVFALFVALPDASVAWCLTKGLEALKSEKSSIRLVLSLLASFVRDLLILRDEVRGIAIINHDYRDQLAAMLALPEKRRSDPGEALRLINQTAQALNFNVNFDHATARLLLCLRARLGGHVVSPDAFLADPLVSK